MSSKSSIIALSIAGVLGAGGAAQAQSQAQSQGGQDNATEVSEVVVSAAPFAVSLNSATTHIEIIKTEQLDTAPLGGLGDVLSDTPGVRSSFFGPGASRPVIRGLSGPRVLVLENGVGMVDASTLSPDHAVATDPAQSSRIEVLRGPSALAYGGAGIGGVVNVIDERIPTHPAKDIADGRIVGSLQSGDRAAATSGYAKIGSGKWVLAIDGSARSSEDYNVGGNPVSERYAQANGVTPIETDTVVNTSLSESAYGAGVSYIFEDGGYLGASAKRTQTTYGIPTLQATGGPPDTEGPVAIHMHQWRYDLRGEKPIDLGPFEKVRGSMGYAEYEHAEIGVDSGDVGTVFLSNGVEGRLELVQKEHDGHQGAFGIQGVDRDFSAIGDEAFIPPVKVKQGGVFTLQRWDRDRWGVDVGLRYDYNDLDSVVGRRSFDNVSASIGAFFRPTDELFLALAAANVGRAPTEFELFADGPHPGTGGYELGDPNLSSERVSSLEATFRYTHGRMKAEGSLFYANYSGYIDEVGTADFEGDLRVFRFVQTDAAFVGGEFDASVKLWESGSKSLSLEGVYDFVRGSTDAGVPARVPPWSVTGRAVWADGATKISFEARRVAAQDRVTAYELPTDGYTMLNASAEGRPLSNKAIKLFVDARNLGDVEAREHVSFLKDIAPLPGRQVRVGMAYDF